MTSDKIVYITYDGLTDNLGQSQILPYLGGLSDLGHDITIVSCEKRANYARNREVIEGLLKEKAINWHYLFYTKKPPVLATLYDLWQLRRKAMELCKKGEFTIVHCRSYLSSLIGLSLKRAFGLKYIFDMRGFWADERVEGGLWNLRHPIFKRVFDFFKRKEREFVRKADAIVSLTHAGKEEISSWQLTNDSNIHVIPCCVDTDLFDPKKTRTEEIALQLGIQEDDFVLSYLGSLGTYYLIEEMLRFFDQLKKEIPNAKFLFVSPSSSHPEILRACDPSLIERGEILIKESPRADVASYISLSNYSVFFYKRGYSKLGMSPTKQGELMAMGIPVICNSGIGDTESILLKYNSGILVNQFGEESFKEVVGQLQRRSFDQLELRNGAMEYYTLSSGIEKYHQIYRQLIEAK